MKPAQVMRVLFVEASHAGGGDRGSRRRKMLGKRGPQRGPPSRCREVERGVDAGPRGLAVKVAVKVEGNRRGGGRTAREARGRRRRGWQTARREKEGSRCAQSSGRSTRGASTAATNAAATGGWCRRAEGTLDKARGRAAPAQPNLRVVAWNAARGRGRYEERTAEVQKRGPDARRAVDAAKREARAKTSGPRLVARGKTRRGQEPTADCAARRAGQPHPHAVTTARADVESMRNTRSK